MKEIKENKMRERNSTIEMLRIFSMILIVMSHCAVHGGVVSNEAKISNWFYIGGEIGVAIFILISGYFMVDEKVSMKKMLRIIGEVWFYTVTIMFIYVFVGGNSITVNQMIANFFPISFGVNWFPPHYVWLMLLSPILNAFVNTSSKKLLERMIFGGMVICSILPTLFDTVLLGGELTIFALLYLMAAYVKRYVNIAHVRIWTNLFFGVMGFILIHSAMYYTYRVLEIYSFLVIFVAIEIMLIFLALPQRYCKVINFIAQSMFGVYLIHDNRYVRPWLWQKILNRTEWKESEHILLYGILSVIIVLSICTVIDIIRRLTFEKVWIKSIDRMLYYMKIIFFKLGWIKELTTKVVKYVCMKEER